MNAIAEDATYGSEFLGGQNHIALFKESAAKINMVEDEKGTTEEAEALLRQKIAHLYELFPNSQAFEDQLAKQEAFFQNYASYFQIESGEKETDAMMNRNIPFQTLYQSFVSRAFAQTQKGYREIGFREVQDLYASIPYLVSSGHG